MLKFFKKRIHRKAWIIQKEIRLKYAKLKFLEAEKQREIK
jgi:hypothetical protein